MDAASASIQPQQPSSVNPPSTTGPQIRSRITVVCAECKRLKLKCDRRAPCGSCTKRGTVDRCIYSPAAAEKVDLHSLNNRLMQVEATLALVTSGQNPPAFQSTYPLAHLSTASSSSQNQGSHQHHHHYAAPVLQNTSFSLSHQDLSLWLEELDLGISLPPSSSSGAHSSQQHSISLAGTSGYIKLEPSPFEIELKHPHSSTIVSAIDTDDPQMPSGNTTNTPCASPLKHIAHLHAPSHHQVQSQSHSQLLQQQRHSAQLLLPALSIYYPVPSINLPATSGLSATAFPHHSPSSPSTMRASAPPESPPPSASSASSPYSSQCSKPQITSALIALLPPPPTCKQILNRAKEIFRIRPVPFDPRNGWVGFEKRCVSLLAGGNSRKKKEEAREKAKQREKEKAREVKRARQIYFSGIPALQSLHQRNDSVDDGDGGSSGDSSFGGDQILDEGGVEEEEPSLAFFAVMCAVLAVGSYSSSGQSSIPVENPVFFFALSQQALGVWDTYTSSSGNVEDREQMNFLLANLISVVYLMLSESSTVVGEDKDQEDVSLVYPLVGKMVNAARGMGLGRDNPERKSRTGDGDASASSCGARKETEKERLWEDWKLLMWWDIMFYDLFIADSLGHQPYMPSYTYPTKLPGCALDRPPVTSGDLDNDGFNSEDGELDPHEHDSGDGMAMQQDDPDRNRHRPPTSSSINRVTEPEEEAYFGARCRLTQLAQTIKHRMAHPECCCGYTLDQAASLESEIRRWQSGLAPNIKQLSVGSNDDAGHHSHPPGGNPNGQQDKPGTSSVSQIQSCELALMANLLMLRVHAPFLRPPSPAPPTSLSQLMKAGSSTSQLNAHSAQSAVHAAQSILRIARSLHVALVSSPPLTSSPIPPSMLDIYPLEKMVLDSIVICASPGFFTKSFPSSSIWMFDTNVLMEDVVSGLNLLSELRVMAEPSRKIVDMLYKKMSHRGTNLLKRKHDQLDMTGRKPKPHFLLEFSLESDVDDITVSSKVTNPFNELVSMPGFDGTQYQHNGNSVTQQQQNKTIDLSSMPVSSVPTSSGGLHQQLARKHKKSDGGDLISSITTAASARLAAAAAERETEKGKDKNSKHAKKSYPSVGIRVRVAKDGSIIRPQRAQATSGSGGQMQAPPSRPNPNPDAVLAFQQQQKQKLQATTANEVAHAITGSQQPQTPSSPGNMNIMHEHRSRSSSFGHVQPQQHLDVNSQSMDLSLPFVSSPEQMDIQAMPTKDYGLHDGNSQRQHPRQPFGSAHMFETQPQPLYEQSQASFDRTNGSSGSADGMSYNHSSPFSNGSGPISGSGSPFTTTSSGHPATPTFPSHHTPPIFGPPPTNSTNSPANYFHGSSSFTSYATNSPTVQSSSLTTLQQHGNGSGMPLIDIGMDPTIMPPPALETQSQQQQQHAMYDLKSSVMDNMSRHHHHQQHFQHPSYDDGSQNHRHMVPGVPPWSSPPPPHQQQQSSISAQNGPPFWNDGDGFKFYS